MTTANAKPPEWRNRDLDDPGEIAEMVRRFYFDVAQDGLLGPMFNEVARVDWGVHVARLTDYWCRTLLAAPGYSGNPYRAHLAVHAKRAFTAAQFERWLDLFHETVDLGWAGPSAERAKTFARKVAAIHSKQLTGAAVVYRAGEFAPDGPDLSVAGEPGDLPIALRGER